MGFRPVSRHRSREVLLYRQGDINVIVNAHSSGTLLTDTPVIAAIALCVRDAAAYSRALERGAHVPARGGDGTQHSPSTAWHQPDHFVDRYKEFPFTTWTYAHPHGTNARQR
jgi:4-hydroxyphenylpyruvate dioxygenase